MGLLQNDISLFFPLIFHHPVNDEVNVMVIQEFSFSLESLLDKSESFGNSATSPVTSCAPDLDPVEVPFVECVIDEGFASPCDDPASLAIFRQPIPDFHASVQPIDFVKSNGSDRRSFEP